MRDDQSQGFSMEYDVHFLREGERVKAKPGRKPKPRPVEAPEPIPQKLPRVVRMLALAHHLDDLIQRGVVKDYAEIARLSGLTRARITQIMRLLQLAPQLQNMILLASDNFVDPGVFNLLHITKYVSWEKQAEIWSDISSSNSKLIL